MAAAGFAHCCIMGENVQQDQSDSPNVELFQHVVGFKSLPQGSCATVAKAIVGNIQHFEKYVCLWCDMNAQLKISLSLDSTLEKHPACALPPLLLSKKQLGPCSARMAHVIGIIQEVK